MLELLLLSLDANLSFDSADLSRRLDGFERTLNGLSSRLRASHPTEVQVLSDRDTLSHLASQQRQQCEELSYFALRAEEERHLSTAKVRFDIRVPNPPSRRPSPSFYR